MYLLKRKRIYILLFSLITIGIISFAYVGAAYVATNRDTKLPPDKVSYDIVNVDEYELLYETDILSYYYREDRDVFAIEDKRTGYTWMSGIDIPFGDDINMAVLDAETPEEVLEAAIPQEGRMNKTYTGLANSILTIEYDEEGANKTISSASKDFAESTLVTLNDNPATRRLDVKFTNIELEMKVYITFEDDSISYEIKDEDIIGKGRQKLLAVNITPFLGASGGVEKLYNPETEMFDILKDKYMIPGYIFVPDGSGSLIRFKDNNSSFSMYYGDVYGEDPAQKTYHSDELTDAIPLKNPVMPVFGVAHGDQQAAFVAYADSGAEYMQIVVRPEENMTAYNYVYPRFVYNVEYYQVYNKKGEGFFTLMDEPNKMDIQMTYTFLAGDGTQDSLPADYTGMALAYRQHLIDKGILSENKLEAKDDIPLRLDFIMADSKKGIVGNEEVVVTDVDDARNILNTLIDDQGIENINVGLYGWQKGGEALSKPGASKFSRSIGKKKDFKKLMADFKDKDIDVSFARDYLEINRIMMSYQSNAAKHINSWYLNHDKYMVLPENSPIFNFSFATPQKSVQWFEKQLNRFEGYSDSMTVGGVSNVLLSNYQRDEIVNTVTETMELYQETFSKATEKVKLNFENPNMYLWEWTDRYLQSPVGVSQYVYQTDAVPFLQMVLHGTMEVYGPYSNFSFYTDEDILRMIDYNISPSFIISKDPSYLLGSTLSADLYSTEFSNYDKLIENVYLKVNESLSEVIGYTWTGREVLKDGVIMNRYEKGEETKNIIINYTEDVFKYNNAKVEPISASVIVAGEER